VTGTTAPVPVLTGRGEREALLVLLDGPRLLDSDGLVLAALAADGRWYTRAGLECRGLSLPPGKDAPPTTEGGGQRSTETIRADELWLGEAAETIAALASSQEYLTGDDLWASLRTPPRQSKMIGNALSKAKAAGIIASTGQHIPSKRGQNHGRPILVWRSLRYGQQTL
jgi:hypothetical protein